MIGISKLYCGAVEVSDVLRYGRRSAALPSHLLQFSADKKPVVVWNCTRACNLKCRHCYAAVGGTNGQDARSTCEGAPCVRQNGQDARSTCEGASCGTGVSPVQDKPEYSTREGAPCGTGVPPVQDKPELSTSEAKAMIDDLAAFGCPVLLFSGGEPCTRGDLVDLMAHAKAKGMRVVLSTNGTLITPELARRFAAVGLSYVGVSLDGLKGTHDAFRGVAGAFEQAIEGIRNAREAGIKVGLRMTISRGNVREIPAVFDVMKRERIARACFYHLVYAGRGSALIGEDLSHDACRAAVRTIMDETKAWFAAGGRPEILTVDNHADGPFVYLELLKENPDRAAEVLELLKMNQGNSSGNGIGCVSWDGEVYADQFWRHFSFGNVRARKFSEIWSDVSGATAQGELMRKLKDKRPHVKGRCAACRWLDVCGGNFRVRAEAATGDLWSPDPACYLTDEEICGTGVSPVQNKPEYSTHEGSPCGTGVPPVQPMSALVEYPDALCSVGQRFFSRLSPTDVHERNLPHWGQDHTLVFVTFRLADALPQETLRKWQCERDEWLAKHPQPWNDADEAEYRQEFPARLEKWLDAGSGSCVLARDDCRKIVADALEYFNDNQGDASKTNGQDARSTWGGSACVRQNGQDARSTCEGTPCVRQNGQDARSTCEGTLCVRQNGQDARSTCEGTPCVRQNGQDARSTWGGSACVRQNGQDARSTCEGTLCGTGVPPVQDKPEFSAQEGTLCGTGVPPVQDKPEHSTHEGSPCGTGVPPVQPRYRLHSFVIMPNHVHVLMELFDKTDLPKVLHSWKSFTAKKINRTLDRNGTVWQDEYFDNLVRNERHYDAVVAYIRQNAKMAACEEGRVR